MILLVCGPAGAGKTTVATRLGERLADRGLSFRLVHSDEFSRNTYDQMYDLVADSGGDWILDGTFYKRRWRERFADLDDVVTIYLRAELETCLRRNRRRAEPIEERAIHVIWHEFDEPDADVTIDVDDIAPQQAVERLLAALEPYLAGR